MPKLPIAGGEMVYHEYGEGDPLLLLHGEYLSHSVWRGQINSFANRFHVVTCDLRGHGESSVTHDPYSVALLAEDVLRLMDVSGFERVMLCGHSLGGLIALELALRYPDRLGALVLAETFYNARASWLESMGVSLNGMVAQMLGHEYMLRRRFATTNAGFGDYVQREISRHLSHPDNYHNIRRMLLAVDVQARLAEVKTLTLILVGEHSGLIHRQARHMNETIKGSFYGVVINAAHMVQWDSPALFNGITLEFLSGAADLMR